MEAIDALLKSMDWASLGPWGIVVGILLFTAKRLGPQLGALVMNRVERSDQFMANTIDRLFKHAEEDRALFLEQMTNLKSYVSAELEKERDFHRSAVREERTMWEQILARRSDHENGSGPYPRT